MKKFYAIVAAALVSVAMFAAPSVVPTDDQLASYATKTYTMCIYNEGACNDIVLTGTYSNWSTTVANLEKFQAVEGFEGWYVVTWDDPDTDPAGDGGIQAKPIQLDGSGNASWDYQLSDEAELIRGTAEVGPGNPGEADIKNIGAGIVVVDVKSWKNNPCTAVYHVYNVALVSPDCNDEEYVVPAISGGFNNWAQEAMTINLIKTAERQQKGLPGAVFEISFKGAEGSEFKFRSSEEWGTEWTNELKEYDAENDDWKGFSGAGLVEVSGTNLVLGETTDLFFDLGDITKYMWNSCEKPVPCDETKHKVLFMIVAPEGAPEAGIEVMGTFDNWTTGKLLTHLDAGGYLTTIEDITECDEFKFREAGNWDNEIVSAATGSGLGNIKFRDVWKDDKYKGEDVKSVELDYSTGEYVWKANWTSIEDVVLTVKAKKVVVDGVMYIVRDNKLFSIEGTQVR